jgi:acetyl esterase/lipase
MCTRLLRSSLSAVLTVTAALGQAVTAPRAPSSLSIYEDVRAGKTESGADVHVFRREKGSAEEAQVQGRWYEANEQLGDPKGFGMYLTTNLGQYEIGDRAPMGERNAITVVVPQSAYITLIKDSTVVAEGENTRMMFAVKEPGKYRVVVSVSDGAGKREWIRSQILTIVSEPVRRPGPAPTPAKVEKIANLAYAVGDPKQQLDVYRPRESKMAPVLFFVHGGYWRSGDRAQYARLGERFANEDIVTVIPSYRLQPANAHPAQINDVAAAFAWTVKNIQRYGGDPSKIYLAGHSAGGHLVELLATDPTYLTKHELTTKAIQGVAAISGVPDVRGLKENFGPDQSVREQASPIFHVRKDLPSFLNIYAQWDYPFLPAMATQFHQALEKAGVDSKLLYVPAEDHISIIISIATKADDPAARAILKMIR